MEEVRFAMRHEGISLIEKEVGDLVKGNIIYKDAEAWKPAGSSRLLA